MATRQQHFVTFYSPGTFVSETTQQPIETWDTAKAVKLARSITERHAAKPYGFRFSTAIVADPVPDGAGGTLEVLPKQVKQSGTYFIGGTILSQDDIRNRADPREKILLSNMEGNDIAYVCENTNSWKSTNPFEEGDAVVDPKTGDITERGNTPKRMAYRKCVAAAREESRRQWRAAH